MRSIFLTLALISFISIYGQKGGSKGGTSNDRREKYQQSYTSNFHKENVGKIVFSKSQVDKYQPAANQSSSFFISDYLYARVFTEKSVENVPLQTKSGSMEYCGPCGFEYEVFLNGKKQDFMLDKYVITDSDEKTWTTRQLWIHPDPSDEPTASEWIHFVNGLPAGNHEITIKYFYIDPIGSRSKQAIASGAFQLSKEANEQVKIGKSWESIQARMSDSGLSSRILELVNSDYSMTSEGSGYSQVKILSYGWKTVYNKLSGVPIYRWIEVNILENKKDGTCYVQNHAVRQEHLGENKYDPAVRWAGILEIYGFEGPIDCD